MVYNFNYNYNNNYKYNNNSKKARLPGLLVIRVAEVAREHGWHPAKSLDLDENFKPEHTLFCRELRFVAIYALFGDLWASSATLQCQQLSKLLTACNNF